jgi:hypothetical protein
MLFCHRSVSVAITCTLLICCGDAPPTWPTQQASYQEKGTEGATVEDRIAAPTGYARTDLPDGSFAHYLRNLPLKPVGSPVLLYTRLPKDDQGAQAAVVDMSVGDRDLQQCADAVMRLRAEYLFQAERKAEISFSFTNGTAVPFARWMKGERVSVNGNKAVWVPGGTAGATHTDLMSYLQLIFSYAGTLSLSRELKDATGTPVQAGDVFIHGGSPGHAVIVLDVAENARGEQMMLLAQSYMPAQDIHVLRNLERSEHSPWYKVNEGEQLRTPEWTFNWRERKRW